MIWYGQVLWLKQKLSPICLIEETAFNEDLDDYNRIVARGDAERLNQPQIWTNVRLNINGDLQTQSEITQPESNMPSASPNSDSNCYDEN